MSERSHVSMEQHLCIVCGKPYDTGAILLDKRLRQSLERTTLTGSGLCPEHDKLHKDGFLALVGVDPTKSAEKNGRMQQEDAYRTGTVMHIKREAAKRILVNVPDENIALPMMFCDQAAIDQIQRMQK